MENSTEMPDIIERNDDDSTDDFSEQSIVEQTDDVDSPMFDVDPLEVIESVAKSISDNTDVIDDFNKQLVEDEIISTDYHKKTTFFINRVNGGSKEMYDKVMTSLKPISKQTQNKVRDAVLQRRRALTQKRQSSGNRLDINAYSKRRKDDDFNIFINSKKPSKNPQMAVSVIVDGSGSMYGDKMLSSMYASMILEDFCRNLGIPFSLISHDVPYKGNQVQIKEFIDFDSPNPKKDRYKLMKLTSGGCNRDGFAIRYALSKIKYRKEPFKTIIIISDGAPNDAGYGMNQAKSDIDDIYKECKKKGIELLAFAIGDDLPKLKLLYGEENLVDCTDLTKFPKTISSILAEKSKAAYK